MFLTIDLAHNSEYAEEGARDLIAAADVGDDVVLYSITFNGPAGGWPQVTYESNEFESMLALVKEYAGPQATDDDLDALLAGLE